MDHAHSAKQAAAGYWAVSPDRVFADDLTELSFRWARSHTFYSVMDEKRRRLLVVVDGRDIATIFDPPVDVTKADSFRVNLTNTNRLFIDEGVALPGGLELPSTTRRLLAGLGGWVGSPSFWQAQKDTMNMWASKRPDDGARIFEERCREPVLVENGNGTWTCEYNYFNLSGGVESWKLEGDACEVRLANARMDLPNGTWLVPYG